MSTVDRKNTEICSQKHQMYAEGISDVKPINTDIEKILLNEGWVALNIDVGFDDMMGFWRWNCDIKHL